MSFTSTALSSVFGLITLSQLLFEGSGNRSSLIFPVFTARCCLWARQKGFNSVLYGVIALALVAGFVRLRHAILRLTADGEYVNDEEGSKSLRPLIFPSRTTHTRLFPKKHSFSYSYLLVGIPVGWKGSVASMISTDIQADDNLNVSQAWFHVNAQDYLERGQGKLGLDGKLARYLKSQGESLGDYPHIYLVTAPRFLGYAFNPVSFWYLYSQDMCLKAMILEVNNTFDERRMYFMKRDREVVEDSLLNGSGANFTKAWAKDFHVSPFNSRKGAYSLVATNPFATPSIRIDNNITLKSSKEHSKIVARVFSTEAALDPQSMSGKAKLRLILAWCWVGFMTFPRILKEAAKLFFQRKLHVWYRPEVMRTSISRQPSWRETAIERCFLTYVEYQRKTASFDSPPTSAKENPAETPPGFKVLTPQFYIDIALARSPASYISRSLNLPPEAQTFDSPNRESIEKLVDILSKPSFHNDRPPFDSCKGILCNSRWALVSFFRHGFAHPLDSFVYRHIQSDLSETYRRAVTSLLLSRYLSFGIVEVLDLVWLLLNLLAIWIGVGVLLDDVFNMLDDELGPDWSARLCVYGWIEAVLACFQAMNVWECKEERRTDI